MHGDYVQAVGFAFLILWAAVTVFFTLFGALIGWPLLSSAKDGAILGFGFGAIGLPLLAVIFWLLR